MPMNITGLHLSKIDHMGLLTRRVLHFLLTMCVVRGFKLGASFVKLTVAK